MLSVENLIKIWCNKINHYNKMKMKIGFSSLLLLAASARKWGIWMSEKDKQWKARKWNKWELDTAEVWNIK